MESALQIAGTALFLYSAVCIIAAVLDARRREPSTERSARRERESRRPLVARRGTGITAGVFLFALVVTAAGYFVLLAQLFELHAAGVIAVALAGGTAWLFLRELARYREASVGCADMSGVLRSDRQEIFRLTCESMGLRSEIRELRSRAVGLSRQNPARQPASAGEERTRTDPARAPLLRTEVPPLPRKRELVPLLGAAFRKPGLSDEELQRRIEAGLWDKRPAKA